MTLSGPKVNIVGPAMLGDERVDPAPFMFFMQAAQTAHLARVRRIEESKIPIGGKSYTWNITDSIREIKLGQPWISFSLTNQSTSAGSVYCRINSEEGPLSSEAGIEPGEVESWNFSYPIIRRIFLQAESGKSATVKVRAEIGEWV